jgi:hypothetical protein
MIDKLIDAIKDKSSEIEYDEALHSQVSSILNREVKLFDANITEEPKTLNRDMLILVI